MVPDRTGRAEVPAVKAGNPSGSNRLTRDMRSQLPLCHPMPPRAWAVWPQFDAYSNSPRGLSLADTPAAHRAADKNAASGALDCSDFMLTPARPTQSLSAFGRPLFAVSGIFEQNRASPADPAGPRR